jgi:hypothetical protein
MIVNSPALTALMNTAATQNPAPRRDAMTVAASSTER